MMSVPRTQVVLDPEPLSVPQVPFFPERLRPRPRPQRRRSRFRMLLLPLLLLPLLPMGRWQLSRVELVPCPGVPDTVRQSLDELAGSSALLLDLQWVQQQVAVWPGVAAVDVHLELPGTLRVTTRPAEISGSLAIAGGWHAVSPDGSLGVRLAAPQLPVLEGFPRNEPAALQQGLAVATRLQESAGAARGAVAARTGRVRLVMPGDLEVTLLVPAADGNEQRFVVHVADEVTGAELHWCSLLAAGELPPRWSDLRWNDRWVVRAGLAQGTELMAQGEG